MACLTAEVLVQGKAEAHDTTLCCASILDDAGERQDKEGDGDTHDGRVGPLDVWKNKAKYGQSVHSASGVVAHVVHLQYIH